MTDETVATEALAAVNDAVVANAVPEAPALAPTLEPAPQAPTQPKTMEEAMAAAREAANEKYGRTYNRDEHGRFAQQQPTDEPEQPTEEAATEEPQDEAKAAADEIGEAPARFAAEAKALWADTPEPVRKEMERALAENEKGIEMGREARGIVQQLDPFFQAASSVNLDPIQTINGYWEADRMLQQNIVRGSAAVMQVYGHNPYDVARAILGEAPADERQAQVEQELTQLRSQVAQYQQAVNAFETQAQDQRVESTVAELDAFCDENPDADFYLDEIVTVMNGGWAKDFATALTVAKNTYGQRGPVAQPASPPSPPQPAPPAQPTALQQAQTRAASFGVSGAPATGSNPDARPVARTIDEAIRMAKDQLRAR